MDKPVPIDQHGPGQASAQNASNDKGSKTKVTKTKASKTKASKTKVDNLDGSDTSDTEEDPDPEGSWRRHLQFIKDNDPADLLPIQVDRYGVPVKAKPIVRHVPFDTTLQTMADPTPETLGASAAKDTEVKGSEAAIFMPNQAKTTSIEAKTTSKVTGNQPQASSFGKASDDVEDLAEEKKAIKETLQKTQDARKPLKLTGLATMSKEAAPIENVKDDGGQGPKKASSVEPITALEENVKDDGGQGPKIASSAESITALEEMEPQKALEEVERDVTKPLNEEA